MSAILHAFTFDSLSQLFGIKFAQLTDESLQTTKQPRFLLFAVLFVNRETLLIGCV